MAIRNFNDLESELNKIGIIADSSQEVLNGVVGFLGRLTERLDRIIKTASRGKWEFKIEKEDIETLRTQIDNARVISKQIRDVEPEEIFDMVRDIKTFCNTLEDMIS